MSETRGPTYPMHATDESMVSDIQIGADGRVHLFGTSREILEALDVIGVRGDAVRQRLARSLPVSTTLPHAEPDDHRPLSPPVDGQRM